MNITVLDKSTMGDDLPFDILNTFGNVITYNETTPSNIKEHVADADILILNKVKITEEVMNYDKNLKLICVFATGYDNIDIQAAKKKGIAVCNVPGYSTDSVVLLTVATVLSLVAHLNEYNQFVRSGEYSASSTPNKISPVYHELRGKCWGIVGFGNIGRAVAEVAKAFGARVVVNKRTPTNDCTCVDIDTLCKESDIITLHCPLNDETRNMINEKQINLMKNSVILVNEARGAVVDEKAVAEAVKNNRIAGFGCDVYSTEPFKQNHPYYEIKDYNNVILTPHAAWAAYEARERCINIIKKNITSFISGEMLNRIV